LQTHLLIGSLFQVERAGNILISFNNYAARAIPLVQQFTPAFAVEFTLPLETISLVRERYDVRRNLLVKFTNDTIDQSAVLSPVRQRFPDMVTVRCSEGHYPFGQDVRWQTGSNFTPFDAFGQWFKRLPRPESAKPHHSLVVKSAFPVVAAK